MIRTTLQASAALRRWSVAFPALLLAACADTDDDLTGPGDDPDGLQVTAVAFPAFAQSEGRFQLWIAFVDPREPARAGTVSAGQFKFREGGALVGTDYQPTEFDVDPADPAVPTSGDGSVRWDLAREAYVSIEAAGPEPSAPGAVLLAGTFLNGTAVLIAGGAGAVATDFSGIGGSFLLATPSTSSTADETNGAWFVQPGGASGSLTLPVLTGSWVYEAWVTNNSAGVASLGRFTSVAGPDSDGAGPLSGTPQVDGPGYPFPGSDFPFSDPGVDLAAGSVIITLEPAGNPDGDGPFFLELAGAPVPGGTSAGTSVPLNVSATFPSLTVTLPAAP